MRTLVFTAFALGATVADSKSLLRGSADPKTLMHRPSQMIGIPAPEGSNFFHPDGLPTWMRPGARDSKFMPPALPSGQGAVQLPNANLAPALGINGTAFQSPVGQTLGGINMAAPNLPGGGGVNFK